MSRPDDISRPIIGIENRTAQEVFDIMCGRITAALALTPAGGGEVVAWRGRYEHPGEKPDEWHLFHSKPANGHADWRAYPLYASPPAAPSKVVEESAHADNLVRIARIIARNIDDERFYSAAPFQRAAQEILAALGEAP